MAKARGRTAQTHPDPVSPTKSTAPIILKTEVTRPGPGWGNKHRGDRVDTSRAYTGATRTKANHANPSGGRSKKSKSK